MTVSLALRSSSALAGCTDLDADGEGLFFVPRWPTLSSGERVLWRVLAWLNGSSDLPHPDELRAELDSHNYAVAAAAIREAAGGAA